MRVHRGFWRKPQLAFDDLPTPYQRRKCFGKRMMNKQQAIQAAARMRKHLDNAGAIVPYRCEICSRWHVGNDRRLMEQ